MGLAKYYEDISRDVESNNPDWIDPMRYAVPLSKEKLGISFSGSDSRYCAYCHKYVDSRVNAFCEHLLREHNAVGIIYLDWKVLPIDDIKHYTFSKSSNLSIYLPENKNIHLEIEDLIQQRKEKLCAGYIGNRDLSDQIRLFNGDLIRITIAEETTGIRQSVILEKKTEIRQNSLSYLIVHDYKTDQLVYRFSIGDLSNEEILSYLKLSLIEKRSEITLEDIEENYLYFKKDKDYYSVELDLYFYLLKNQDHVADSSKKDISLQTAVFHLLNGNFIHAQDVLKKLKEKTSGNNEHLLAAEEICSYFLGKSAEREQSDKKEDSILDRLVRIVKWIHNNGNVHSVPIYLLDDLDELEFFRKYPLIKSCNSLLRDYKKTGKLTAESFEVLKSLNPNLYLYRIRSVNDKKEKQSLIDELELNFPYVQDYFQEKQSYNLLAGKNENLKFSRKTEQEILKEAIAVNRDRETPFLEGFIRKFGFTDDVQFMVIEAGIYYLILGQTKYLFLTDSLNGKLMNINQAQNLITYLDYIIPLSPNPETMENSVTAALCWQDAKVLCSDEIKNLYFQFSKLIEKYPASSILTTEYELYPDEIRNVIQMFRPIHRNSKFKMNDDADLSIEDNGNMLEESALIQFRGRHMFICNSVIHKTLKDYWNLDFLILTPTSFEFLNLLDFKNSFTEKMDSARYSNLPLLVSCSNQIPFSSLLSEIFSYLKNNKKASLLTDPWIYELTAAYGSLTHNSDLLNRIFSTDQNNTLRSSIVLFFDNYSVNRFYELYSNQGFPVKNPDTIVNPTDFLEENSKKIDHFRKEILSTNPKLIYFDFETHLHYLKSSKNAFLKAEPGKEYSVFNLLKLMKGNSI